MQEKMHMMGVDGVTALVRAAARVHPRERLLLAKVDWRKMFHQAGLLPAHRRYFVSFALDTETDKVVAIVPRCMTFGGRAQPQQCSRMPRAVVIVARRFFGILCDHHVDDVVICGPSMQADADFICYAICTSSSASRSPIPETRWTNSSLHGLAVLCLVQISKCRSPGPTGRVR